MTGFLKRIVEHPVDVDDKDFTPWAHVLYALFIIALTTGTVSTQLPSWCVEIKRGGDTFHSARAAHTRIPPRPTRRRFSPVRSQLCRPRLSKLRGAALRISPRSCCSE